MLPPILETVSESRRHTHTGLLAVYSPAVPSLEDAAAVAVVKLIVNSFAAPFVWKKLSASLCKKLPMHLRIPNEPSV